MLVLSVDIGWRHLAYTLMEVNETMIDIKEWKIVDIIDDESINVNTSTTDVLINKSAALLGSLVKSWITSKPSIAYLENQPLGQMARNIKTKTLSHVMQALLIAEGINVQFVSPKKKLKGMEDIGSYSDNKKFAVASTVKLLEEHSLTEWKKWFEEVKGKKDDLADAMLQGYYAAKTALIVKKPKRAREPKKKRNSHLETELSLECEL